jgi:hypothetical protein
MRAVVGVVTTRRQPMIEDMILVPVNKQIQLVNLARDFGFIEDRAQDLLVQTAQHVSRMIEGHEAYGRPAVRRDILWSMAKHLEAFRNCQEKLDIRTLVSLMGPLEGAPAAVVDYAPDDGEEGCSAQPPSTITMGLASSRIIAWNSFVETLTSVQGNCIAASKREIPDQPGAPPTSDPIVFGIEALAGLWRKYRQEPPTSSQNEGQFGQLVLRFFSLLEPHPMDSEVRTGLRRFAAKAPKQPD